ncbi:MAG: hypothetical protein HC890_18080 [Chloroflexaceae bacterium]|nr:hypothetical protein [Chloroflexaceae bacterium]
MKAKPNFPQTYGIAIALTIVASVVQQWLLPLWGLSMGRFMARSPWRLGGEDAGADC